MNTAKKNQKKIREGSVIADVIIFVVVALLAFICLYPMYFVLVTSLSEPGLRAADEHLLVAALQERHLPGHV